MHVLFEHNGWALVTDSRDGLEANILTHIGCSIFYSVKHITPFTEISQPICCGGCGKELPEDSHELVRAVFKLLNL